MIEGNLLNLETNTKNANSVRDGVIDVLYKNGDITAEKHKEYKEKWGVVLIKNGWFHNWVKKFKKDPKDWHLRFIKLED